MSVQLSLLNHQVRGHLELKGTERDPADRRAVRIRAQRTRGVEVLRLYSGMYSAMDEIIGDYDEAQLDLLAGFLRRTAEAGRAAAQHLADG